MKSMQIKKIISWLVLLSWMLFIYYLSDQPAVLSAETSRTLSQQILEAVRKDPTPQMVRSFDAFLRNSAHFGVFFILGIFAYFTFSNQGFKFPGFISFVFGTTYAFSDEVHQIFVAGRAFQLRDLALDSLGGFLGVALASYLLYLIKKQQREKRNH